VELIRAGDRLNELPFRGVPVVGGRRKLIIGNYLVFYRVTGNAARVTILAVIDGRRMR